MAPTPRLRVGLVFSFGTWALSLPTFLSRDSRNPCIFVLVLVLSPQGGTRTRLASYIEYEYEYEYHFIEYEYDGSPKDVGKDKPLGLSYM